MSSANGMLESVSVEKAKQLFMEAGGRVNYQVKYQGKAAKSYLMPHSAIPREVLQEWQQCNTIITKCAINGDYFSFQCSM